MATRDNLPIIKAARTGVAAAQLTLGSRYFFGKSGLPQSTGTAFYWLERAARQGLEEAFLMIGRHVPYDMIATMPHPHEAVPWYEKAFEAGIARAGLIFARLVLDNGRHCGEAARQKALSVLKSLADRNDHDAQWMLAQYLQQGVPGSQIRPFAGGDTIRIGNALTQQAAQAGVEAAQYVLVAQAWSGKEHENYRRLAMPLAERLLQRHKMLCAQHLNEPPMLPVIALRPEETGLLLNLAGMMQDQSAEPLVQVQQMLELAALGGSSSARCELGLRHARMDREGQRSFPGHGVAHYKKAVTWLLLAARDGVPEAWHTLSRVYAKSEFSQRDLVMSRRYLERAAEMGLLAAQFEYAQTSWRNRREASQHDVRAVYWWLKAAGQGHAGARKVLLDFSRQPLKGLWAEQILDQVTTKIRKASPFLCMRLEIAAAFGLSRPEALLLDVIKANHGHCLEVDISQYHAKSRRRLVLIQSDEQRESLMKAGKLYGDVDAGFSGPEGNYRQRQYRLKTLLPDVAG